MDGGPFRTQQPTDRRVINRPERRQPEEPQPVQAAEPKVIYRPAPPQQPVKEEKSLKRFIVPVIVVVAVILLGVASWFMWANKGGAVAIDSSKYQAVFFSNGQVYFGKLHTSNNDYMRLTDIYYLQSQQPTTDKSNNPQATDTNQNNVQLVKLGDEIHGPEDEMIISKDQILFYENLKSDGKVAQSIDKSKDK